MSIEVHVRIRPNASSSVWSSAETVLYSTNNPDVRYVYNKVHHGGTTNQTIFHGIEPLVHAGFGGKNVTVMAYGQTGSGKTHSMNGTASDLGVVPRTAQLLLDLRRSSPDTEIYVYFTEIYNESVKDLLDPQRGDLALHDAPDGGVFFDKKSVLMESLECFAKLQNTAERNRKYGVTNLNDHSSRSHMILTFEIQRSSRQVSTINLVDLAGSESASRANTDGMLLREGGFINKSLLTLGNVVDAIVDKRAYVPYRDAKLTRILRNCLGGSGMTFILCCINPSMENFEQTVSSLRFTQRAMKIKNDPVMVLNMPPLFAHQYSKDAECIVRGIHELSEAYYQRGIRDVYMFSSTTVSSAVSAFEGQVSDSLHAMANAQRLLIAHDHAIAIEQVGRLYNQLEEATRQRKRDREIEERELKRQREVEDEIEVRRNKIARLEEKLREREAVGDTELAGWEYQLYEAQQTRVTPLTLLLAAERARRCRMQYEHALCIERIAARWVPAIKSLGPLTRPVADKQAALQQMRQCLQRAREELEDLTIAHDMIKEDLQSFRAAEGIAGDLPFVDDDAALGSFSPRTQQQIAAAVGSIEGGDSVANIDERIRELEREEKLLMSQAVHVARCESARRIRESLTGSCQRTPRTSRSVVRMISASPARSEMERRGECRQKLEVIEALPIGNNTQLGRSTSPTYERSPTPRTARAVFPTADAYTGDDVNVPLSGKRSASPRTEQLADGMRRALGVLRDVRSKLMRPTQVRQRSKAEAAELVSKGPSVAPSSARSGSRSGQDANMLPPICTVDDEEGIHLTSSLTQCEVAKIHEPVIGIAARRRLEGVPPRPNVDQALWRLSLSPVKVTREKSSRSRRR
uniref:Kinesin-like protein n=1 Tax=Trypanosoma congolense (strain IL3000) TaxID=1068625 RepID=G0UZQ2_TRYCI|nr:putative kinesin [Trypanosoma congolense IL3000]